MNKAAFRSWEDGKEGVILRFTSYKQQKPQGMVGLQFHALL